MTEESTLLKAFWYQGIDALLKGDEDLAQEIWMAVMLKCQVDKVEQDTKDLLNALETTSIELLQVGNYIGAKKCYGVALDIDATFHNPTLDKILWWQERYTEDCENKGYHFTTDWFSANIPIWNQCLKKFTDLPNLSFFEVGSWEGRSTCWLLDNILTNDSSTITCLDTFEGSIEHEQMGLSEHLSSLESIFDHNIQQTGRSKQVTKLKGASQLLLRQLPTNTFDFYYIDGSHVAPDVLLDTVLGWDLLKQGGIMIFDDYEWGAYRDQPTLHPKLAVDSFIAVFQDRVNILHKGYQFICEKVS